MYHFISGYTAKVAGTEMGVTEPQATFSACFGGAFLVLHPARYAEMLAAKMQQHGANVWLVNTGMTGGGYGVGQRMSLKHTRAVIDAIHDGSLDSAAYVQDPVFGVAIPQTVPHVPSEILNPRSTWKDSDAYDAAARKLAGLFNKNFEQYREGASSKVAAAGPRA
jgi:phosphoenolpyruvate carboxykinase (ATP)